MVERKDPVLWGPEFSERGHAYLAIARGRHMIEVGEMDEFPGRIADGKKAIRGQLRLVNKYPHLEGPWMEAVLFAFSKLPPENAGEREVRDMAERRVSNLRRDDEQAIKTLHAIREDMRALLSFIDETKAMLVSAREKGAEEKALEKEIAGLEQRLEGLRTSKRKEAGADDDSWNDVEAELDQEHAVEAAEEEIRGTWRELEELAGKAEAEWNEKLAQEESLLEGYNELLAEQMAEAAKFTGSMSATVRREAANVLMEARDARSLISFCYAEMDPDAREAAFRNVVEAARAEPDNSQLRMGMRLSREERSMLLRMVEDTKPEIASLAWEFAEWMLGEGRLDDEQMDFLEMQAKDAGDMEAAARVLSKRAKIWVAGACGGESEARVSALVKVLEGIWAGLELDEEQRELLFEFTEDIDQKVAGQALILAIELCRKDGLMPEQVATLVRRANRIEDAEKRMGTMAALFDLVPAGSLEDAGAEWLMCMAMAGHPDEERVDRGVARALEMIIAGKASPEQVEMFVALVDSLEQGRIKEKKPRIFEGVSKAVRAEELSEKAARILEVDRVSQIFLDTVQPGRASRLPARRSDPPQDGKNCAPREAKKLKC